MIVQNQYTAWVVLALIVLCMAIAFGMNFVSGISFGPSQAVKDEQARIDIRATEAALYSIQTPQAVFAGQTAIAAELTALPLIQTATAIGSERNLIALQQAASQTKTAEDLYLNSLLVGATATALVQSTSREGATEKNRIDLAAIAVITFCLWMIGRGIRQIIAAHTQEQAARANLLEAQRKLLIERSIVQVRRRTSHPSPVSSNSNQEGQ